VLELFLVILAFLILHRQMRALETGTPSSSLAPHQPSPRMVQMATYADRLYAEKKWLAAEKAYLGLLKLDHKNVTAYSHLGIIYSTQKNMADAIECFQIAVRLRPSGVTYQNLALSYFDNHNYIKSIAAFEKAIMFEPTAQRYMGLGKSQRKLHNLPQTIAALEKAAELEPSRRILQLLAEVYSEAERKDEAVATQRRILELEA
jgi:tetratricopeptide (TPR) repeat protein